MRIGLITTLIGTLLLATPAMAQDKKCDVDDLQVATAAAPPQTVLGAREVRKWSANLPERADFVVVGDSIGSSWPKDLLQSIVGPNKTVANLAFSGARTGNLLWMFDTFKLWQLAPKKVLLVIGTNDLASPVKACAVTEATARSIERIRALWPEAQITNLQVLPRGPTFQGFKAERAAIADGLGQRFAAEVNYKQFNAEPLVTCAPDEYVEWVEWAKSLSPNYKRSCRYFSKDNLHLSSEGYKAVTKALSQQF